MSNLVLGTMFLLMLLAPCLIDLGGWLKEVPYGDEEEVEEAAGRRTSPASPLANSPRTLPKASVPQTMRRRLFSLVTHRRDRNSRADAARAYAARAAIAGAAAARVEAAAKAAEQARLTASEATAAAIAAFESFERAVAKRQSTPAQAEPESDVQFADQQAA